jgi:hypothetical protein
MGTDYSEKEREFIASLSDDTGKDLNGWLQEISSANLASRNDIIDWLRHRGFTFAKASWLERIYHNGGRLIYADEPKAHLAGREPPANPIKQAPPAVRDNVVAFKFPRPAQAPPMETIPPPPTLTSRNTSASVMSAPTHAAEDAISNGVKYLLVTAKGLRPLAEHIVKEIARAVPGANFSARAPLIVAEAPQAFVALWPNAKMLKIYGNFGAADGTRITIAEPIMKAAPPFPHMIALDDARLVDQNFRDLIHGAATRANI